MAANYLSRHSAGLGGCKDLQGTADGGNPAPPQVPSVSGNYDVFKTMAEDFLHQQYMKCLGNRASKFEASDQQDDFATGH